MGANNLGKTVFLLVLICLLTVFSSCRDEETEPERQPPPADRPEAAFPFGDDDIDEPERKWGLWFGNWGPFGWAFEEVPTSATISPRVTCNQMGLVVVLSERLTEAENEPVKEKAIYLSYRMLPGDWTDAGELGRTAAQNSWASLLAASDGSMHVLYNYDGHPYHINLGADSYESEFLPDGPSPPDYSAIAEDAEQRLHAVYGSWGLAHMINKDEEWIQHQTFAGGAFPDLAFGDDKDGHLVYLVSRGVEEDYSLYYHRLSGSLWVGGELLSGLTFYPAPHITVDEENRAHLLVPSSIGLMYLQQAEAGSENFYYELVAGNDWSTGYEYADILIYQTVPFVVFRNAATAQGYMARRLNGVWEVNEFTGFDGGFLGLDLAGGPVGEPYLVFAGWRQQ